MLSTLRKCHALMDGPARRTLAMLFGLILVAGIFEAFGIGMVFPFVKLIQDPAQASGVPVLGPLLASIDPGGGRSLLWGSLIIFGLFVFKNAIVFTVFYARTAYVQRNQVKLAVRLLRGYVHSPYTFHLDRNSAEIIRNLNSSAGTVYAVAIFAFVEILTEVTTATAVLVTLIITDPLVTAMASLVILLSAGVFLLILPPVMRRFGQRGNVYKKELIKTLQQCLGGIKEIKVLGREAYFETAFRRVAEGDAHIRTVGPVLQNLPRYFIEVTLVAAMLVAVYVLTRSPDGTSDILPVIGVFALAAYRLLPSANRILSAVNNINFARAPVEDVHRDMQSFTDHVEADRGAMEADLKFEQTLSLEGVSYTYPGAASAAIEGVSETVRRGESIGIVGRSGAGKTTLIDLILGVLAPAAGRLAIDGHDVADNLRGWQRHIGYVPQSIYLTDDTLRRNVAFGIDDSDIEEERIVAAIAAAFLDDLVASLADGLDTVVGEQGVRLSGGQRQRIGIARALYHDPNVLVMDEATSAVDNETERHIAGAIEALRGEKTILIIAHRLSTVRHCDRLIFLDGGRPVSTGSFDELMADCADFRALVEHGELAGGEPSSVNTPTPVIPRAEVS
jgi:ABC-type multidrug transport system fused ATPase/permease subunit